MINYYKRSVVSALQIAKFTNFDVRKELPFTRFIHTGINNMSNKSEDKMAQPPWREASSLIIASRLSLHDMVAKGRNLSEMMSSAKWNYTKKQALSDYRILLVKRSKLSSFMANAFVFPGGMVEPSDYSPDWWAVFENLGISRNELQDFSQSISGPRPPLVTNPLILQVNEANFGGMPLTSDIALRIAAIRETFEETGILLLTNPALENSPEAMTHTLVSNAIDIKYWQDKVHQEPRAFIELCHQSEMCPDIWSLFEWSDWLTPSSVGHRRYDTMFYLCCLPRQPDVLLDQGEVTVMKWASPEEMLADNCSSKVFLAPPQVYELSRLLPIQSYHELHNFAKKRQVYGCERWLPIISTAADGAISLLPGDDLYPESGKQGISQQFEFECAIEDLRLKSKNLHRLEISGLQSVTHCNITPSCGHLQPLPYRSSGPIVQSFL